jgi:hypothetical protein
MKTSLPRKENNQYSDSLLSFLSRWKMTDKMKKRVCGITNRRLYAKIRGLTQ